MAKYLVNFTVYILAMVGVAFTAYIVWKNATNIKNKMSKSSMKIEDSLSLAPRKNLYIIKIENERFLIASDADKTTFLSKLENSEGESFEDIQNLVINQDENDEITSQIKLKENENFEDDKEEVKEEEEEEIVKETEEEVKEEVKKEQEKENKPVNILQELKKRRGIN